MRTFFKELFEYSHYYNEKLSDIFNKDSEKLNDRTIKLFSHILNAHHIWNSRIMATKSKYSVWEVHSHQILHELNNYNLNTTCSILDNCDLNKLIMYSNSMGNRFENKTRDILFHIVNHSTYHRGQIAAQFRAIGIEPLSTDYIFYKR